MEPWRHPNDRYLFLSDLHLGTGSGREEHQLEQEAVHLLDHCIEADLKLVLLGDLFDYWMEFGDSVPPIAHRFLDALQRYNRIAGPTLYITGNHDNWTSGYFESIGCTVEPEWSQLPLGDRTSLLLHGDGLADPAMNLPRPVWHRLLRSGWFVTLFQHLFPARTGWRIMATFSRWNRERETETPERLDRWARETLEIGPYDFVICGHDHIPRIRYWDGGIYMNCGAFYSNRTAIRYTNGKPELVVWKESDRCLHTHSDNTDNLTDGR